MNSLMIYLFKSTVIISVLYAGYELFLRKEAYFGFNRFYMLFTLILALFLPFFNYPVSHLAAYSPTLPIINIGDRLSVYTLEEVVIRAGKNTGHLLNGYRAGTFLLLFYVSGVIFQLIRFLFRLIRLGVIIRKSDKIKAGHITFVLVKDTPTHSFMHWVFTDPALLKNGDFSKITAHEQVHISQRHTLDLLLTEILIIIQWFNPFIYLLRKRIKENHEYLTDRKIVSGLTDFTSYSTLLMQHSGIIPTDILTHNFSYSLLKRRLQMMKKPKRPFRFGLGITMAAALLAAVLYACSSPETNKPKTEKVYTEVDEHPEFPGGMQGMIDYLSTNIHYPPEAKEQGIEGRVFINFIVEKDGSVDSAKILRGIGGGCDEEALRVVSEMPEWTPGKVGGKPVRVSFNLPVKFTLDRNDTDTVYTLADTMPKFPGGMEALMNYLSSNITYPEQAKKDGVHGRVFINFIVEKDGRVTNVKLLRGFNKECDEEALRVVRSMPNWIPGIKDGHPVRVSYNIPIKFALD